MAAGNSERDIVTPMHRPIQLCSPRWHPSHTWRSFVQVDMDGRQVSLYRPGHEHFLLEPKFVPRPGATEEDDGWLLSVGFHSGKGTRCAAQIDCRLWDMLCCCNTSKLRAVMLRMPRASSLNRLAPPHPSFCRHPGVLPSRPGRTAAGGGAGGHTALPTGEPPADLCLGSLARGASAAGGGSMAGSLLRLLLRERQQLCMVRLTQASAPATLPCSRCLAACTAAGHPTITGRAACSQTETKRWRAAACE